LLAGASLALALQDQCQGEVSLPVLRIKGDRLLKLFLSARQVPLLAERQTKLKMCSFHSGINLNGRCKFLHRLFKIALLAEENAVLCACLSRVWRDQQGTAQLLCCLASIAQLILNLGQGNQSSYMV
jgi:hypothetical protein